MPTRDGIKSIGGAPSYRELVFRPGASSQSGNIYNNWADLMTGLNAIDGPRTVFFDDSITSPCVVPAGGPYDMTDVTWEGRPSLITIADGASFTKLLTFRYVSIKNESTTSPMTLATFDSIRLENTAEISQSGGGYAPMFDGSGLGGAEYVFITLQRKSSFGSSVQDQTVIDLGGSYSFLDLGEQSRCCGGVVAGTGTIGLTLVSPSAFMFKQPAFSGTYMQTAWGTGPQWQTVPPRGTPPSTSPLSNTNPFDWIRLNADGGTFTQGMPRIMSTGTGEAYNDGRGCVISELGGINGITLDGNGSETIDGAATYELPPGTTVAFISDGVSNWTSMRDRVSGETALVFQPGGTDSDGVYTDWPSLMGALIALGTDVPKIIFFDHSFTSPCVIPAGGPYDMTGVIWKGVPFSPVTVPVTVADGASFTKLLVFSHVYVRSEATSSPMTLENADMIRIEDLGDISCTAAAAAFFDGSALSGGEYVVLDLTWWGSIGIAIPNETVIDLSAAVADSMYVQIGERSYCGNDTISCNAAGAVDFILNATSGSLLEQPSIAGTFTFRSRAYPRYNQNPSRTVAPATANISDARSGDWIRLNAGSGTFTQTLPHIFHIGTSTVCTDGYVFIITETSGVNGVTLDGYSAETIDGASSYWLPPGATEIFISDGVSNWTRFRNDAKRIHPKRSPTQDITAVGDTLLAPVYNTEFTSDGAYTLTSTPTIADGQDGEEVVLCNVGANVVTLQDESGLAGSNLYLDSATVAIGTRDSIRLIFRASQNAWVQQGVVASIL